MAAPASAPSSRDPAPDCPAFSVGHLDRSVDPSVDFYRFAAGTWAREHPVPGDKARWGAFDELREANFRLLREILEEARAARAPPGSPEQLVGDLYASAVDTTRRNELGFRPIGETLDRVARLADPGEVVDLVAAFHSAGVDALFETYAYPDKKASGVYAFYLEQGGLSLPDRDYYLDPAFASVRAEFEAHVARMLELLGDVPAAAAVSARTIVALETELARAARSRAELRQEEKNYHRVELPDLVREHPAFPWRRYLAGRGLTSAAYVIVGQPEFFEAVDRLLVDRPLSEWRAYLRWRVVHEAAPLLHEAAEVEDFAFFSRTLLGQAEPEPLWKRAALAVDSTLGEALGALYVARAFPPGARTRMQELVDDLCAVFRERLETRAWMGEETRRRALAKFARFSAKIGHPERFRDYVSVRVDRDDYAGNVRRARAFEVQRRTGRVGGPVDRTEWEMTPPTVNAYFSPVKNEIVFPAGILQPPFFDVNQDDAVNYGGIGAVIGHEITHGYDDQGRKYDVDGNLTDWWSASDVHEFGARAQRVVAQYSAYEPLPGLHLNGELTLGENLADLGGVSIAFAALQRRLECEPARRRPIDGFTPEQRFFLSWAQVWRQNAREPEVRRRVVIDPHSPGPFRAVGAVVNHDGFFEAFGVRPGTPMWRAAGDRVSLW